MDNYAPVSPHKTAGLRTIAKHWVFTAWSEPALGDQLPPWASFIVFGTEVCPDTNRVHWQGYLELTKKLRIRQIRALFETVGVSQVWLGLRLGSPDEAIAYCQKDGIVTTLGTPSSESSRQGQRNDLQRIADEVASGEFASIRAGITSGKISNYQQLRVVDRILPLFEPKRDWKPTVIVHWGPSGTGKSRLAKHLFPDSYRAPASAPKWWPGYDGHETVWVDEFRGSFMPFAGLLDLLDRYEYQIEYKGGHRQLLAKTFVFTSPFHPRFWYPGCAEQLFQLLRRISYIRYFYAEVNESSEISDIAYTETDGVGEPLVKPVISLRKPASSVVPELVPEVGGNISLSSDKLDDPDFDEILADLIG